MCSYFGSCFAAFLLLTSQVPAQTEQLIIEIHSCWSALCENQLPFCLPDISSHSLLFMSLFSSWVVSLPSPFLFLFGARSLQIFRAFTVEHPASPLTVECLHVTTCQLVTVPHRSTVGDKDCFLSPLRCRAHDNSKPLRQKQPVMAFLEYYRIFQTCTTDFEYQGSW